MLLISKVNQKRLLFFRHVAVATLIYILAISCSSDESIGASYLQDFESWKQERVQELVEPHGWLSLVGLFWLEEGINTFGSSESSNLVLPDDLPEEAGFYIVNGDSVSATMQDSAVTVNGVKGVRSLTVNPDIADSTTTFASGSYEWIIIKRGDKFGLRIWDNRLLESNKSLEIPRYPLSTKWIVEAKVTVEDDMSIIIDNEVGMKLEMEVPAILSFELEGKQYQLQALDGGEDQWFVIFADNTTGNTTYGSGRYLYVQKPLNGNSTQIDFNKAYNPPCTFTDYATCLLPPVANHLDLSLTAGEKYK